MQKTWKPWDGEDCPLCGGDLNVETSAPEGQCHDGDAVNCDQCAFKSGMTVDEDGTAWVQEPYLVSIKGKEKEYVNTDARLGGRDDDFVPPPPPKPTTKTKRKIDRDIWS